jgi:hypothetical protein
LFLNDRTLFLEYLIFVRQSNLAHLKEQPSQHLISTDRVLIKFSLSTHKINQSCRPINNFTFRLVIPEITVTKIPRFRLNRKIGEAKLKRVGYRPPCSQLASNAPRASGPFVVIKSLEGGNLN